MTFVCHVANNRRKELELCAYSKGLPDGIFADQKRPVLVNFGKPWNETFWYILWQFGVFCGYSVYFVAIWYILR
jgi:hypothetical protein